MHCRLSCLVPPSNQILLAQGIAIQWPIILDLLRTLTKLETIKAGNWSHIAIRRDLWLIRRMKSLRIIIWESWVSLLVKIKSKYGLCHNLNKKDSVQHHFYHDCLIEQENQTKKFRESKAMKDLQLNTSLGVRWVICKDLFLSPKQKSHQYFFNNLQRNKKLIKMCQYN